MCADHRNIGASRRGLIDVQARCAVGVERAAHLAMARDLDAEQPGDVDLGRDPKQRIVSASRVHRRRTDRPRQLGQLADDVGHYEPPFEGGTNGADQSFSNAGGTVYSPAVNPKLKDVFENNPGVTVLYYPFDQAVSGVAKDGRIIIMK